MKSLIRKSACYLLSAALLASAVPSVPVLGQKTKEAQETAVFGRDPVFSGAARIQWKLGEPFDPNSPLTRVFADDLEDGDLTGRKEVLGNDVNTQEEGVYKIAYTVTDSDYHTAAAVTEVEVGSFETAVYQRTLYTVGKNQALLDVDYLRGYYHDRQNLGIFMPADSSLRIRILNAEEFQEDLSLQMYNNDSETEQEFLIPGNGEWIDVTNGTDSVPFIHTPKAAGTCPVVEYQFEGAKELTYYRYGDDEQKFWETWDENQDAYAVIEGSAATFLVPYTDRHKIINYDKVSRVSDRFQSLDEMLDWYQDFVDQYDEFSGLDYHALNPADQNIRSRFFIKANKHGVGQAYYTTDHSAFNGDTLQDGGQGYFCRYWLALHEFAHGYEGSIRDHELSLVETTNNILAHYFQQTYLTPDDHGWLGNRTNIERRAAQVRENTDSFNEITAGRKDYDVSLYMFVNVLDKIGPRESMGALHRNFRRYRQEHGKDQGASDVIIESFGDTSGYNLIPYFETYHIQPNTMLKSRIYQEDYEIPYYLRELVETEQEAEGIKEDLQLRGIYDLVTPQDLGDTGYRSDVTIHFNIDDLDQIKGRRLTVKDGSKVVKSVEIQGEMVALGELPIGAYELELPNTLSGNYRYDHDFLLAAKGRITKEITYEAVTANLLADETEVRFVGLNGIYASLSGRQSEEEMNLKIEAMEPHSYFPEEEYAKLTVLDETGRSLYEKAFIGNEMQTAQTVPIAMKEGYKIQIYYAEAWRLRFYNRFFDQTDTDLTPSADRITTEYVMTPYGLMKSGWTKEEQEARFLAQVEEALEKLKSNLTENALSNKNWNFTEKLLVKSAVNLLEEEQKQEILEQNRELFWGSAPEARLLKKSLPVGRTLNLEEILEIADAEDGNLYGLALTGHEIPLDAEGKLSEEGIYPIHYEVTDKDGNRLEGTIRFTVSPYVEREEALIPSDQLYATAESQEEGYEADLAVDGSEQTCWQTQAAGSRDWWADLANHRRDSIVIDLGTSRDIGRLDYIPNGSDAMGQIKKYKLYYSTKAAGNGFKPIPEGEGIFTDIRERKSVNFGTVHARRLKVQALETTDGRISASEFYVYEVKEQPKTACTCVIEKLQIQDLEVTIPFDQEQAEARPEALAVLGGNCKVPGHSQEPVTFAYEIIKDENRIGSTENGKIMVNGTGTLELSVTASANGKSVSGNTQVQAVKLYSEPISSDKLKGFADSEQGVGADGFGRDAVDGNEATYWHSNYSTDSRKPDISGNVRNGFTIDLGGLADVHKLEYVPRQDSKNGRILGYRLYYSKTEDQEDFAEIPGGYGAWENNKEKKQALFEPVTARRIRILALSTEANTEGQRNKFITAAEFYPYQLLKANANEYEGDCTCTIDSLLFFDDTVTIPHQASKIRIPLKALADLGGDCFVEGHGRDAVVYEFTEMEDPDYIGFIENEDTLVLKGPGVIKIRAAASIPGTLAKAEKTAVITVRKEKAPSANCTCSIRNLAFADRNMEMSERETIKEIRLKASSRLSGDCREQGHQEGAVTYHYEIAEDEKGIGIIAGDRLFVLEPGTIRVKVAASVEGTRAEGVAATANINVSRTQADPPTPPVPVYTLSFDPCGGVVSQAVKSIQRGSAYGQMPIPSKPGYQFKG